MNATEENTTEKLQYGKIISVRGSVVDVRFENNLPPVYTLLHSGKNKKLNTWLLKLILSDVPVTLRLTRLVFFFA